MYKGAVLYGLPALHVLTGPLGRTGGTVFRRITTYRMVCGASVLFPGRPMSDVPVLTSCIYKARESNT